MTQRGDWGAEHEYPSEINRTIINMATWLFVLGFLFYLFNSVLPGTDHIFFRSIRMVIVVAATTMVIASLAILRSQLILRRLARDKLLKRFHIEHDRVVAHIADRLVANRVAHRRWSQEGRLPLEPVPSRYKLLAEVFELELLGALIVVRRYGNLQKFDRYTGVFMGPVDDANRSYMEKLIEGI